MLIVLPLCYCSVLATPLLACTHCYSLRLSLLPELRHCCSSVYFIHQLVCLHLLSLLGCNYTLLHIAAGVLLFTKALCFITVLTLLYFCCATVQSCLRLEPCDVWRSFVRPSDTVMSVGLALYHCHFPIRLRPFSSTARNGRPLYIYHRFRCIVYSTLHDRFYPAHSIFHRRSLRHQSHQPSIARLFAPSLQHGAESVIYSPPFPSIIHILVITFFR